MAVFEAVETPFPRGMPERFVAALSVRVVGGGWLVRLNVRPGLGRGVGHLAEEWALREVLQVRADGTDSSSDGQVHGDPERLLVMREYATLEDLPEPREGGQRSDAPREQHGAQWPGAEDHRG